MNELPSSPKIYIESLGYDRSRNTIVITGGHDVNAKINLSVNQESWRPSNKVASLPYRYSFRYDVPLKGKFTLTFRAINATVATIEFTGQMSKLSTKTSYWLLPSMQATHNRSSIKFKPRNYLELALREVLLLFRMLVRGAIRPLLMRLTYWATKPLYFRKNIWLFTDKVYKAGDNAEYLYKYTINQKNSFISPYYILSPESDDVNRFRSDGIPFVKYKSLKQRVLFLNSKILIFTHNNAPGFYRFGGENSIFFRDLYNYDVMYIQHGLSVQEMSELYNKSVDDIKQYFIASPLERKNLLRPEYGFSSHEVTPVGLARYDGLVSNPKNNILIAPTWRKGIANSSVDYDDSSGVVRDDFKTSTYFRVFNSLINNPDLTSLARRKGYRITLLLHPSISDAVKYFKSNQAVTVKSPTKNFSYEKELIHASALVTDYSGLQFDFAYMNKPIIYYHPEDLPPSYTESAYKYKNDSLGQVVHSEQDLVQLLKKIIAKNYITPSYIHERIDDFFYYHDKKNCQRIYQSIVDWQTPNNP